MLSTRPTAWVNERSTSLDVYDAGAAEVCVAAKIRKSSIFMHRTCLPHLHASNACGVNEPLVGK